MKEDFLHYVWRFQKFNTKNLSSVDGKTITIVTVGTPNENAGPDFFNAKVSIDSQLWVGNVEIHIKSSDWYTHHHEIDASYDNVILHVVWKHDTEIFRKDNSTIPTLELNSKVNGIILNNYQNLFSNSQKWINCENEFSKTDFFTLEHWLEQLYLERLEEKSIFIKEELKASNNHWEELLFKLLLKNFGLKVNGDSFFSIAKSVTYSIFKKCNKDPFQMEAILFGQAGFLEISHEDSYFKSLKERYSFLKNKYKLDTKNIITPKYFRLRPSNFPSIRLSQVAVLFSEKQSLFSELITAKKAEYFYSLFNTTASEYWETHYNFGIQSTRRKKRLTKKFIDLLLINTVIPLLFSYSKYTGKDRSEEILQLTSSLSCEENTIVANYNKLLPVFKNALQSQALLQLKNEYCNKKRCLQCAIGNSILKAKQSHVRPNKFK